MVSVTCDVADRRQVERLADAAVTRFGRIDTWVNNAGQGLYGFLEDVTEEDNRRLFDINYRERALSVRCIDRSNRGRDLRAFEEAEQCEDPEERRRYLSFVVIGGGPTGVELAGALAELARSTLRGEFRRFTPDEVQIALVE